MAKKKGNNTVMLGVNLAVALFAVGVIISMFLNYTQYTGALTGKVYPIATGFELFNADKGGATQVSFIVLSLIFSAALAGVAILRILGMFNSKFFTLIFAAGGVALIVISIILFSTVTTVSDSDFFQSIANEVVQRGVGVILNLVFSIIAGLAACGAFVLSRK